MVGSLPSLLSQDQPICFIQTSFRFQLQQQQQARRPNNIMVMQMGLIAMSQRTLVNAITQIKTGLVTFLLTTVIMLATTITLIGVAGLMMTLISGQMKCVVPAVEAQIGMVSAPALTLEY